jgi:DNA-binding MarR family transcriptional regulator
MSPIADTIGVGFQTNRSAHHTMPQHKRAGAALSLSDEDRDVVAAFLQMLEPLFAVKSTMPLQYVKSLLLVALNEGAGVTELALKAGQQQSVMSRHLLDIGDRSRTMKPGMGLVTSRANPNELRKSEYFVTPEGVAVLNKVIRALRSSAAFKRKG